MPVPLPDFQPQSFFLAAHDSCPVGPQAEPPPGFWAALAAGPATTAWLAELDADPA